MPTKCLNEVSSFSYCVFLLHTLVTERQAGNPSKSALSVQEVFVPTDNTQTTSAPSDSSSTYHMTCWSSKPKSAFALHSPKSEAITHTVFILKRQLPWSATVGCCQACQRFWSPGWIYNSMWLHDSDNPSQPFPDLFAHFLIKLSGRKCPSLDFLLLMLNQHLSACWSALIFYCAGSQEVAHLKEINKLFVTIPIPFSSGLNIQYALLRNNNKITRGFPDPLSAATFLDKGLRVYLRKQSLGRGWSGLTDRLVQHRPTSCPLRTLIRRKDWHHNKSWQFECT